MAKDLNKVMLIGRLGADPEMRYLPSGSAVVEMRIATDRTVRNRDGGEDRRETEWTTLKAWDKLAEICAQYLKKGSHIYAEGRLQTRSWEGQDGQKRYRTEVVLNDMIMLDTRNAMQSVGVGSGSELNEDDGPEFDSDGDMPF